MFSNTSGTTSVLWIGLLTVMAGGVALAANVHLTTDEEGEHGATGLVAATSQGANEVVAARGAANTAYATFGRTATPAPAILRIGAPTIEFVELDGAGLAPVELQKPARSLPPISVDANSLVKRLLDAGAIPRAPAPIAVEAPDIREADFEAISLRGPDLRRPPLPELPAVRP